LVLAKTSTSDKALMTVIDQVLNHPSTFIFGELLAYENVKKLETSKDASKHLRTLQLLAYGAYSDYQGKATSFVDISKKPVILRKLKMLSLVNLGQQFKTLSYDQIAQSCGLTNTIQEVEELVMDTYQNQLIQCRIDQRNREIHILSVFARDVRP
jgi:hypothetical protein